MVTTHPSHVPFLLLCVSSSPSSFLGLSWPPREGFLAPGVCFLPELDLWKPHSSCSWHCGGWERYLCFYPLFFPLQQLPLRSCERCAVPGASLKLSRAGMTRSWRTLDLLCHLHPSLWGSGFHQHFPNLLGQPPFPSRACPSVNLGEPTLFLGSFLDCCPDPNLPPPLPFPFSWKQQLRESSLGGGREKTALRADDFSIN